jgi:hypothetical protein
MVRCKLTTEDRMRIKAILLTLCFCLASSWPSGAEMTDRSTSLLSQRSSDLSAARKKRPRATGQIQAPLRHGPPDPSFGPDGKLYPVPEYLRGQCYYDDGYGRFSPCSNRN